MGTLKLHSFNLYTFYKPNKSRISALEDADVQSTQTAASIISKGTAMESGNGAASDLCVVLIKHQMIPRVG